VEPVRGAVGNRAERVPLLDARLGRIAERGARGRQFRGCARRERRGERDGVAETRVVVVDDDVRQKRRRTEQRV
jgi:hypothetical protein